jgi:hypothetical protein
VTFKGSGTLIVRLGAPPYIALTVNGLAAKLPSGVTAAYSVELTPASASACLGLGLRLPGPRPRPAAAWAQAPVPVWLSIAEPRSGERRVRSSAP